MFHLRMSRQRPLFRWILVLLLPALLLPTFQMTTVQGQSGLPVLLYSSYAGGDNADYVKDLAVDAAGNILVIGETFSDEFLGVEIAPKGYSDLFVAKFDPTATDLLYLTILGGNDSETALSIEVDAQGNAYGTGATFDETFPTKNALWPAGTVDANSVLFKLDPAGEVVYSTYLPDNSTDAKQNLAVDAAGNAYIVGTRWGVQEGETFLMSQISMIKLDPSGSRLLLDRHLGGPGFEYGNAIAVDSKGAIYLAGNSNADNFPVTGNALQPVCGEKIFNPDDYCDKDGVVAVLTPAGDLVYASYHGGNGGDEPGAIAADGQGNFVVAGETISGHFPLANALQDSCPPGDEGKCYLYRGFASMFHLETTSGEAGLVYSTYLGANDRSSITEVLDATMDSAGHAYISGYTNGKQFPTKNAVQELLAEGFCQTFSSERYCFDGFITQLSPSGQLVFGSYTGGITDEFAYGITVDRQGNIYVAGATESGDFPTTANAFQPLNQLNDDGFVVKIGEAGNPPQTPQTPQAPLTPQAADYQMRLPSVVR